MKLDGEYQAVLIPRNTRIGSARGVRDGGIVEG